MHFFRDRRQGVNRQGGGGGSIPADEPPVARGGTDTSAITLSPLTSELMGCDKGSLKPDELRAINYWRQSNGNYCDFLDFVSGDVRMAALLHTERVRTIIARLAEKGECLDLVAGKEEIALKLTELMRDKNLGSMTKMAAAEGLAKLNGLYPKGEGGVNITLNFSGGLGD